MFTLKHLQAIRDVLGFMLDSHRDEGPALTPEMVEAAGAVDRMLRRDYDASPMFQRNGTVRFSGVDFEGRKVTVHYRDSRYLVLKVSGGKCWKDQLSGHQYVPAELRVYAILQEEPLRVARLVEFPLRPERAS